jgi:hypothetical protein
MVAEIKIFAENKNTKQQANLPSISKNNDQVKYKKEGKCSYLFPDDLLSEYLDQSCSK